MFNSQYYTCEQVDERLLQGYVDDFNEVNSTNYSKEELLLKLLQAINWDQIFGKYEENLEFVRLYLDSTGKFLWGIRTNGDIYYGAGVPSQIKDYINNKISELHLNKVDDILIFLDDLLDSDKTLKDLLEELDTKLGELDTKKVDKEEGKSLIDSDYASGIYYIENPEFIHVKLDSANNLLEATRFDGTKLINGNAEFNGDILVRGKTFNHNGFIHQSVNNPEFLKVEVDSNGIIINAIRRDGDCIYGGINISDLKRDLDLETIYIGYDVETDDLYTIENEDSAISLEYDPETGDVYEVYDTKIQPEPDMVIDPETGDVYIEQDF